MILVPVRQHDAEQIIALLLDELQIGQDQVDARIGRIGEGNAHVDHQPFALTAVQIDVHADLAGSAERDEEQFIAWYHLFTFLSQRAAGSRGLRAVPHHRQTLNCQVGFDHIEYAGVLLE